MDYNIYFFDYYYLFQKDLNFDNYFDKNLQYGFDFKYFLLCLTVIMMC